MRGVYTEDIKISAVAAAQTLIYITAPSGIPVEILSASVTNSSLTTAQELEVTWQRITTLGTPTATTLTPTKMEAGDQAAAATVKGNVTASEPTYTASTTAGHEGYNNQGGWYYQPTPEERFYVAGGASAGLRMLSTPTAVDLVVRVVHREIG